MLSPMTLTAATEAAGLAVRCSQPDLERALARVARATAARPLMPVLGTVLLTAADGRLTLAATDLELAVTAPVAGVVEREGAVAMPARLLADFVASLPAAPVDLTVDPSTRTLRVAGARARAAIKGLDPDDFPAIPPPGGAPAARVEAGRLRDLIGRVAFSAGTDDSRPTLKGVHLQLDGARLTLAAADGYRLTEAGADLDAPAAPASAIVPARGLRELARLLADPAEIVEIRLEPNRIGFAAGGAHVLVRLIDGAFPDYRAVIPAAAATRAIVDTAEARGAIRRAAAFARDAEGAVRLRLDPAGAGGGAGRLTLARRRRRGRRLRRRAGRRRRGAGRRDRLQRALPGRGARRDPDRADGAGDDRADAAGRAAAGRRRRLRPRPDADAPRPAVVRAGRVGVSREGAAMSRITPAVSTMLAAHRRRPRRRRRRPR